MFIDKILDIFPLKDECSNGASLVLFLQELGRNNGTQSFIFFIDRPRCLRWHCFR